MPRKVKPKSLITASGGGRRVFAFRRCSMIPTGMRFEAYAAQPVEIAGLQVQHKTLARSHSFELEGRECSVQLPDFSQFVEDQAAAVRREQSIVGASLDDDATWFGIYAIGVATVLPEPVDYDGDESSFRTPKVAESLWGRETRVTLPLMLNQVFDHWLRMVRWVTLSPVVDRAKTPGGMLTFTGGYQVFRSGDNKLFDAFGGTARPERSTQISADQWDTIQSLFDAKESPPLWFDYLSDGLRRLRAGDPGGAIVSTAIACETVIRAVFWLHVPKVSNKAAAHAIDAVAVQGLLGRWGDLSGLSKSDMEQAGKGKVHRLFDARNAVMHRGDTSSLDNSTVTSLLENARKFVVSADGIYRSMMSMPIFRSK